MTVLVSLVVAAALVVAAPGRPTAAADGEVRYFSDVVGIGDSISRLYRVTLDPATNRADLTLLKELGMNVTGQRFDQAFAIAATPDGTRVYAIDSFVPGYGNGSGRLGYYDIAAGTSTEPAAVTRTDTGTTVEEFTSFTVVRTAPADPSEADTAAGFRYAFDCGTGYSAFTVLPSATCPTLGLASRVGGGGRGDQHRDGRQQELCRHGGGPCRQPEHA